MCAVAKAKTALAHDAQPSVRKRSAGRAWFELRLSMSTPSGSKSRRRPKSADDGPPRHTAETPDSRHALRLILISADASRCRCILRRPTVLKRLLLPSLLPLLMMMTLMTLLLLLHCRCRCRRCCRGFHCPCCCCGRCGVCWLPPQRASNSAAAAFGSVGGGFMARAAAASGRYAWRRQRHPARQRRPRAMCSTSDEQQNDSHARTDSLTDPHKAIVVI